MWFFHVSRLWVASVSKWEKHWKFRYGTHTQVNGKSGEPEPEQCVEISECSDKNKIVSHHAKFYTQITKDGK